MEGALDALHPAVLEHRHRDVVLGGWVVAIRAAIDADLLVVAGHDRVGQSEWSRVFAAAQDATNAFLLEQRRKEVESGNVESTDGNLEAGLVAGAIHSRLALAQTPANGSTDHETTLTTRLPLVRSLITRFTNILTEASSLHHRALPCLQPFEPQRSRFFTSSIIPSLPMSMPRSSANTCARELQTELGVMVLVWPYTIVGVTVTNGTIVVVCVLTIIMT